MAVTVAGFAAARLAVTYWVRPNFASPVRESLPLTAGSGPGFLYGMSQGTMNFNAYLQTVSDARVGPGRAHRSPSERSERLGVLDDRGRQGRARCQRAITCSRPAPCSSSSRSHRLRRQQHSSKRVCQGSLRPSIRSSLTSQQVASGRSSGPRWGSSSRPRWRCVGSPTGGCDASTRHLGRAASARFNRRFRRPKVCGADDAEGAQIRGRGAALRHHGATSRVRKGAHFGLPRQRDDCGPIVPGATRAAVIFGP